MPMKEWIYRLQPVQLYIVLTLTVAYFAVQMFLSQISHALVLLVNSYHMLCNIIALTGCILTIKKSTKHQTEERCKLSNALTPSQQSIGNDGNDGEFVEVTLPEVQNTDASDDSPKIIKEKVKTKARKQRESSLKNTFGWTRIDILTMLVVCIFMASLCFSAVVEALQTLAHIHHQDAMHYPIEVMVLGAMGLVLNGFCYILIGGYTYHQGSFLVITSNGNVILDHVMTGDGVKKGNRRLSGSRKPINPAVHSGKTKRQSVRELMRDICTSIFVIICSVIVYYTDEDENTSKFVDPICSIISCVILLTLSYPYMKESGLILLQTIPNTIDIEIFRKSLMDSFKDVISVHDLHIWQLSGNQYVSTAHIIFENPQVYTKINEDVVNFFHDQGIIQVTVQPEFKYKTSPVESGTSEAKDNCLIQCRTAQCIPRQCCDTAPKPEMPKSTSLPALSSVKVEKRCTTTSSEHISITVNSEPSNVGSESVAVDNVTSSIQKDPKETTAAPEISSDSSSPVMPTSDEQPPQDVDVPNVEESHPSATSEESIVA